MMARCCDVGLSGLASVDWGRVGDKRPDRNQLLAADRLREVVPCKPLNMFTRVSLSPERCSSGMTDTDTRRQMTCHAVLASVKLIAPKDIALRDRNKSSCAGQLVADICRRHSSEGGWCRRAMSAQVHYRKTCAFTSHLNTSEIKHMNIRRLTSYHQ